MMNNLKGNFELMRELNTAIVLRIIWEYAPVSRADIVKKTNLTGATVSRIVGKLIEHGIVKEVGYGESQGGRKPILMELNHRAVAVIGVDIEVDEIIGVLVDLNGNILHRRRCENREKIDEKAILGNVKNIISDLLNINSYREKVIGIGIGMHGLVDYHKGISIFPPAFGWSNVPVAEIISKEFNIPTILENNDRALALGENWFGAARNMRNFMCLKVGTGIGSGIFTNGEVYRGVSNSAGEIGHTTVDEDGEYCSCGNYGCLESMASIPAIIKKTKKLLKQGAESKIYGLVDGNIDKVNETIIFEAARKGDSIARQILRDEGRYLGIGVANVVNLLNPEAVIVGGKIIEAGELVLDSLKNTVKNRALSYPYEHINIMPSELGKDGVVIGAATLILERVLKFDKFKVNRDMPSMQVEQL